MKRLLTLLLALAVVLTASAPALAAGDGSGDNRDEPITVVSSSLSDGAVVSGDSVTVVLEFNKNVVNFSVRENNMGRFALYHESGRQHPITVHMGDDQVDPSVKRLVEVSATGLEPGGYTLVIMKGLTAKNGVSLAEDIELHFRVEGPAPEQPVASDEPAEPAGPAEPELPAAPGEQAEPAGPERPAEPEQPAESDAPSAAEEQGAPEESADPERPGEEAAARQESGGAEQPAVAEDAQEGEAGAQQGGVSGTAVVILAIAVLGIAALFGRRRTRAS